MSARPLSVVIPTRDRPAMLDRTLERLLEELRPDDEVVVVDSASSGRETRAVAERHGVRFVRSDTAGVSLARNLGWRAAQHDAVAFIDDDILVDPGWADAMRSGIDEIGISFVTGRVELPEDAADAEHASSLFTDVEPRRLDAAAGGLFGGSGNVIVRRDALIAVQGFDERLGPPTWFGAAEDVDFFDRLVEADFEGVYEPRACVRHVQWRDDRQMLRVHWAYGKGMGARLGAMVWRDRGRARRMLPQMLRLEGIKTAASDVRERRRRSWGPPIAWRLGALVGFAVGVVRLRRPHLPRPRR